MQILLIDDEPIELFIAKKFLAMEFQVIGFNTLKEALAWARANSFDVLVSDFNLDAGMQAHHVLKSLREIKGNTFRPFVLTNHVDEGQANTLIAAGFEGIIEKPLSLEKFKSAAGL